jgi:hypothetical protein
MTKAVALTPQGGLHLINGRFYMREGGPAQAQCITEHLCLEVGEDTRNPFRGLPWQQIFKQRTSPRAVANATARELNRDPIVKIATAEPHGSRYVPTPSLRLGGPDKVYSIDVHVIANDGSTILATLEKGNTEKQ